jgi:ribosomal protein S15P/S13E
MIYECTICSFVTDKQRDYSRHIKTKKHINKCINRDVHIDDSTTSSICHTYDATTVALLNEQIKQLKNYVEDLKKDKNNMYEIVKDTTHMNKSSMSAFTFLITHHPSAPPLSQLTHEQSTEIINCNNENIKLLEIDDKTTKKDKDKICAINDNSCEIFLNKYKNYRLHMFVGDAIVSKFKTNDPDKQSFWNSDTNRRTYLLMMGNSNGSWITDKRGVKLVEYVIRPILNNICVVVTDYCNKLCANVHNYCEVIKKKDLMVMLRDDINFTHKLENDVLNYLGPFFYLDKDGYHRIKQKLK